MALHLQDICDWLEAFAPHGLAEDWDNVGLLVGDSGNSVSQVMTCLTVTPESAAEAIAGSAELIVTHHPMLFRPIQRLTRESTSASLLLDLIAAGVGVYSPHTAFDSAVDGINQSLATGMSLRNIAPLIRDEADPRSGSGRMGELDPSVTLGELAQRLGGFLSVAGLHRVGSEKAVVRRVAVACGSGGSFLTAAIDHKCDVMITGEATFHTCLEAQANGVALLLPGHFASERFAVEMLALRLAKEFDQLHVWSSTSEQDPLNWHSCS